MSNIEFAELDPDATDEFASFVSGLKKRTSFKAKSIEQWSYADFLHYLDNRLKSEKNYLRAKNFPFDCLTLKNVHRKLKKAYLKAHRPEYYDDELEIMIGNRMFHEYIDYGISALAPTLWRITEKQIADDFHLGYFYSDFLIRRFVIIYRKAHDEVYAYQLRSQQGQQRVDDALADRAMKAKERKIKRNLRKNSF